jgi:hypothetical protein
MELLFTVANVFSVERGLILAGFASTPDQRLSAAGELVEIRSTTGHRTVVNVIGIDWEFSTRSCFSARTLNRALLVERGTLGDWCGRDCQVWSDISSDALT